MPETIVDLCCRFLARMSWNIVAVIARSGVDSSSALLGAPPTNDVFGFHVTVTHLTIFDLPRSKSRLNNRTETC